jgi:uncharacterized repeat protein (TIGR04076 family)
MKIGERSFKRRTNMAVQPTGMDHLEAEVISIKGECGAGHTVGQKLNLGCWDTGGLCGFFYHDIFPNLSVLQFEGKFPWGSPDELTLECPDRENAVTLKVRRNRS